MRNVKKMLLKTMITAATMAMFFPAAAFADEIASSEKPIGPGYSEAETREYISSVTDDVVMRRYNALPVDAKKEAEAAIKQIPDEVLELYRNAKGKMFFRSHTLQRDLTTKESEYYTAGLYRYNNARIEILADHATLIDENLSLTDPIYHEFGHFLYNMTWSTIDVSAREAAYEVYASDPTYYGSVEEAFADSYMAYKNGTASSLQTVIGMKADAAGISMADMEFAPPA